jgi:hypothetical protein
MIVTSNPMMPTTFDLHSLPVLGVANKWAALSAITDCRAVHFSCAYLRPPCITRATTTTHGRSRRSHGQVKDS